MDSIWRTSHAVRRAGDRPPYQGSWSPCGLEETWKRNWPARGRGRQGLRDQIVASCRRNLQKTTAAVHSIWFPSRDNSTLHFVRGQGNLRSKWLLKKNRRPK